MVDVVLKVAGRVGAKALEEVGRRSNRFSHTSFWKSSELVLTPRLVYFQASADGMRSCLLKVSKCFRRRNLTEGLKHLTDVFFFFLIQIEMKKIKTKALPTVS